MQFIGVGETLEKLEPFYPDRMASRILGMGDVVSLVEKAQEEINQDDAMAIFKKMMTGTFDFDDFMTQTRMISKMGSLSGQCVVGSVEERGVWTIPRTGAPHQTNPLTNLQPRPQTPKPDAGMMKMIPGMAGVLPGEAMYEGEKKLFAYQEMINVMEAEER